MKDITLRLRPHESRTFANFRVGLNGSLLDHVRSNRHIWLHGSRSVGKSHVAQALVGESRDAILISESSYELVGLDQFSLIVFDDIGQWLENKEGESQILGVYEQLRTSDGRLVVTATKPAAHQEFSLRDLESRMRVFQEVHLLPLPEHERVDLLLDLAANRGIEISQDVANFLLVRLGRSQHDLLEALDKLDDASVIQQRRITIPFAKRTLRL